MKTKVIIISMLILFNSTVYSQQATTNSKGKLKYARIEIRNSELRTFPSKLKPDRTYYLKILLPENYQATEKTYPVLYLLDADVLFPMMPSLIWMLNVHKIFPEIIIVGIGVNAEGFYNSELRGRDYAWWGRGKAKIFYNILKDEIIPFAESEYRIDSADRALYGFSLSGCFVLYALFQDPKLFQRYISISSLNVLVLKLEEDFAQEHSDLPAELYIAIMEFDGWGAIPNFQIFKERLESRKYSNLVSTFEVFKNAKHAGAGGGEIYRALEIAYLDYEVKEFYQIYKQNPKFFNYMGDKAANNLGYSLLAKNQIGKAIEIFKTLSKLYPKSAYTSSSLAKAYMAKGDTKNALHYVKQTQELIPDDPSASDQEKESLKEWANSKLKELSFIK